ncbi:uncharacterized protein LY89DRAFT_22901 [Mollisia scopiformis]|uniref:Uncharacterized protein n=1 Tax=Mollisia scopiformis TaxID=149040 RepID=A0A194XXD5_MOLSC|nr:uncharacterized protein LY89DRAFT_22901 [Mollisia scopiformis]KUJ24452.1 hypothetical protein LY89DRAFT_22901 [Mollisia scopiformis]
MPLGQQSCPRRYRCSVLALMYRSAVHLSYYISSVFLPNFTVCRSISTNSDLWVLFTMASTDPRYGSLNSAAPEFYPPLPPHPQATWRSDSDHVAHRTVLDRFEEQWRSSQGRVVPIENINSPPLDYARTHSPILPSANAPFYVPRQYESPVYQHRDRQDRITSPGPEPVYREQNYVQVNQAPRPPVIRPSVPGYQPWQRIPDMERSSDYSRPPFNSPQAYQDRVAPRPATVPPQQYRQQLQPRHTRPESRSRRHNPYTESRRRRRSTSSQPRHPQKRRYTPPQHNQRQFPSRPSLL